MRLLRFAVPFAMLLAVGCVTLPTNLTLWQEPSPDALVEKDLDIGVVGDVTEVDNAGFIQVSGVGLVTGLDGTGHSPKGPVREMLEAQLRKQVKGSTAALLNSPNNALVLLTTWIPPGARPGDHLDIEIVLPEGSKTSSLKGGYLIETSLYEHAMKSDLSPDSKSNGMVRGHVLAKAKGPLITGMGNPLDPREQKRALVWSGGVSLVPRAYIFKMTKDDKKSAKVTANIANRINVQFQDDPKKMQAAQSMRDLMLLDGVTQGLNGAFTQGMGQGEMAKAVNKEYVSIRVPYAYRYNHERFLRVARLLPIVETTEAMARYRDRLDKLILDPKQCIRAAYRLEALGEKSAPILRKGLESPDPLVRFSAAESLTYLGSTAGVEELAKLVVQHPEHPEFRAYGLLALAGLDEAICRNKLGELMLVNDPELRSGAFRALRLLDENDPRLNDEPIAGQFFLHRIAPESEQLVLFSMHKRAEIVLFGPEIRIRMPVKILAGGEFTITAEADDTRVTVSRLNVKGTQRKQTSPLLEDVIRAMADLGAGYAETIDLLKELDEQHVLPCAVNHISPPGATGLESLMAGSRSTPGSTAAETTSTKR
jgi:Flagellar P-ring protein